MNTVTFVDGDLDLSDGKGVLWVTGNLTIHGNTSFDGIILIVGKGLLTSSGGGNGHMIGTTLVANIAGPDGVYGNSDDCTGGTGGFGVASHLDDGNGNHDTIYCSDAISKAMFSFPMKVASFRQR